MRLLLTSLVAGGCFLAGASVTAADELRLDDAALDNVTAGATMLSQRRSPLFALGAFGLSQAIVLAYNKNPDPSGLPVVVPIVNALNRFSQR